jgi:hypothetical protein
MGLSSAVIGSEVAVGSAVRATVVRAFVLELEIGLITTMRISPTCWEFLRIPAAGMAALAHPHGSVDSLGALAA